MYESVRKLVFRVIFICLIPFICGPKIAGQQSAIEVSFPMCVWSKEKGFAKNLKAENIEVFIKKIPQKIISLKQDDEPTSIGILFDLSGSIDLRVLPFAVQGLVDFINRSNPKNEYFIIGFAKSPTVLLETTQNKRQLLEAIQTLVTTKTEGGTVLFAALETGFEKMKNANYKKKALIVVSDGQENGSKNIDSDDIRNLTKRSDVLIYFMNMNANAFPESNLSMRADSFFEKLTQYSGGRRFYPKTKAEVKEHVEMMADELRSQYIVTFLADSIQNKPDWRELEVRISKERKKELGKVVVRARGGLYF